MQNETPKTGKRTIVPKDLTPEQAAALLTEMIFQDSSDPEVFKPKE